MIKREWAARGLVAAAMLSGGCTSYITPHPVYAPLLDHAGQVDVSVRGGPTIPGAVGVNANLAYAPIDHLEIIAGGDFNFGSDTRHYAGHVGLGTFVRDDVLRFEAIAGVYGGLAEGLADGFDSTTSTFATYALQGPYAMPYVQAMIGFESGHIELAGGARLFGFMSDVTITPLAGATPRTPSRDGYERMYVEPVVTVRIPFDIVRIDFMTAWPININSVGDNSPSDLSPEFDVNWYLAVGVAVQIDTVEQRWEDPEPMPAGSVYVPASSAEPTTVAAPPAAPETYELSVTPPPDSESPPAPVDPPPAEDAPSEPVDPAPPSAPSESLITPIPPA